MDLQLEHPELLQGLWLLPLLWLATWRSRALRSMRSKVVCAAIRSVVLALAIVALSQPFRIRWQEQKIPAVLGLLVDRSHSVQDVAMDADAHRLAYAPAAEAADRTIDLEFAGAAWSRGASGDAAGTDIAAALERMRAELEATAHGAVILVTDGRSTQGDPLLEAGRLRTAGVRVHVVPIGQSRRGGPRIVGVQPPAQARVQEPARIRVRLRSDYPARTQVRLLDANGMEADRQTVDCDGECVLALQHVPAEPGLARCTVLLTGESQLAGEQTMAPAAFFVEGPPKVLLVDTTPQEAAALAGAWGAMGLVVEQRPAAGLSLSSTELNTFEAVILSDVAAPDFDAATQADLVRYVEERGGGLVFIGGRNVSARRWHESRLERILPVELLEEPIQVIEQQEPVHVCFVLDKSGSMDESLGFSDGTAVSKLQRVKDAVRTSLKELPPMAIVSVVVFDAKTRVLADSVPAGQWATLANRVDRLAGGGGTIMDDALETAIQLIRGKDVPGHIILLTDGVTALASPLPAQDRWGSLIGDIRDGAISLTTVGVGSAVDRDLLEYLADSAGGTNYLCSDADEIPKVFIRQAATIRQVSRLSLSPFAPRPGPAANLIRNIKPGDYPQLAAALSSRERPLGQVVLTTDQGKPLLAVWPYGLGNVAAFTSDAKGVWARRWVAWPSFGRFWSQVAGWVLRRTQRLQVTIDAAVAGQEMRLLVHTLDSDGRPATGLKATGEAQPVAGSDAAPLALTWRETRPGTYEARARLAQSCNHLCQIHLEGGGRGRIDRALILRPAESVEMAQTGPDLAALEAIASAGGGQVNPSPGSIADDLRQSVVRRIPDPQAYWPWLVLAAIVLWPADVMIRRFVA